MAASAVSTHVEMNLARILERVKHLSCLHTRGDEPVRFVDQLTAKQLSPHTWR